MLLLSPKNLLTSLECPPCINLSRRCFSKRRATTLPPHWPYDCAIDLIPGTIPPRGHNFSLSPPERAAMDSYIKEALAAGFIRPSTSPAEVRFFFVGEKDGGLRL